MTSFVGTHKNRYETTIFVRRCAEIEQVAKCGVDELFVVDPLLAEGVFE